MKLHTTLMVNFVDKDLGRITEQSVQYSQQRYYYNRIFLMATLNIKDYAKSSRELATTLYCFTIRSLTRVHSRKRPALVTTTFSNLGAGRLRERRLYRVFFNEISPQNSVIRKQVLPFGFIDVKPLCQFGTKISPRGSHSEKKQGKG